MLLIKKLFITRALMHRPDFSDAYGGPVLMPYLKVFVSNRKMRFDRENDYYRWKKITGLLFSTCTRSHTKESTRRRSLVECISGQIVDRP